MTKRLSTEVDYQDRILRVQDYVDGHLDDELAPSTLASVACFSLHHFHRVFRGQTGETVLAYARRKRLERAARRLRSTPQNILQVAVDAGYGSHEAFTRAFQDQFGVVPSQFRESLPPRLAQPLPPPSDVRIVELPPIPVLYERHTGPWSQVEQIFPSLLQRAAHAGIFPNKARLFGRCPDDPDLTPQALLRYDACIETIGKVCPQAEIPGGLYAITTHHGPYSTLSRSYLALIGGWLPLTPYALHDEPVVEAYLNDPQTVPENELLTEVRVRLRER